MRSLIKCAIITLSAAAWLAPSSALASGGDWSIMSTTNPSGTEDHLYGISCQSTGTAMCTAVGSYVDSKKNTFALAERWNGDEWVTQAAQNHTGIEVSQLQGVSCVSFTACQAVGESGTEALAESWNGKEWSTQKTPAVGKATKIRLLGVSCTSSSACTAVGSYTEGSELTLAERWNGKEWVVQKTPNPEGGTENQLNRVSCTSAEACTAVGYDTNKAGNIVTLAEGWNGKEWTIEKTPTFEGSFKSVFLGVSCVSKECIAVGSYIKTKQVTLAERWDGKEWTVQTTPNPEKAEGSVLHAISCPGVNECTAPVDYVNSEGVNVTKSVTWDGKEWTEHSTENPAGSLYNVFWDISCSSNSDCNPAGYYKNSEKHYQTMAGLAPASSWRIKTTTNPSATENKLFGISCSALSECTSVGLYVSEKTTVDLAERWNGTEWTTQTIPNPAGAKLSLLLGVSCASAKACTAVGYYENSEGSELGFAEGWNGTEWKTQAIQNPTGGTLVRLLGVSCTASNACTAVGSYFNSEKKVQTLVETWNGTEWKVQTSPSQKVFTGLESVSCTASNACTAVGYTNNSKESALLGLAERWNGTEWKIQTLEAPAGAESNELSGVSCASSTACTAVGKYHDSKSTELTLAERWNGTEWKIQTTPNPTEATGSTFSAVSCATTTACTAMVNFFGSESYPVTRTENWDGKEWTLDTTMNPGGSTETLLEGISCLTASECRSVGYYQAGTAGRRTLGEKGP